MAVEFVGSAADGCWGCSRSRNCPGVPVWKTALRANSATVASTLWSTLYLIVQRNPNPCMYPFASTFRYQDGIMSTQTRAYSFSLKHRVIVSRTVWQCRRTDQSPSCQVFNKMQVSH